jgi:Ras-related protein Rab-2A
LQISLADSCTPSVDTTETREITREEAQEWAEDNGMAYIETSAKTGQGIEEAFETTAKKIHERLLENREKLTNKRRKGQGSFPGVKLGAGMTKSGGGCC